MSEPRRLIDDPEADGELQQLLRESAGARPLDAATRRRVGSRVARAAAVPVMAAGWMLFVKSAAAALGAVGVAATVATATGVIEWPAQRDPEPRAVPSVQAPRAPTAPMPVPQPVVAEVVEAPEPEAKLHPLPSLPVAPSASGATSLAAESTLLEQARREMRRAPAVALQIAGEHAQRFPRGQLAAERTLIEVEALHRLGRPDQARARAQSLLRGAAGTLYAERVQRLLGE